MRSFIKLLELSTPVPPSRKRMPADQPSFLSPWVFSSAIARASSYVVPPMMNTMMSCSKQQDFQNSCVYAA